MSEAFCPLLMMKSETSVFSLSFHRRRVFSGSFKGGKNTDILKVALKCSDTATRNNKEFAGKSKFTETWIT